MLQQPDEEVMVVILDNLVQQALPRTFAIRQKLEKGEVLEGSEIEFFVEILDRLNHCQRNFLYDSQCKVIFSTVSHLIFKVAKKALKNEKVNAQIA